MTLEFTTNTEEPLRRIVPFILDGEEMSAAVPKAAILVNLARKALDPTVDEREQIELLDEFLDDCMTDETAARLRERLADKDDHFDYTDVTRIVDALQGEFAERPPTKPAASTRSRRPTGKGSTARARSVG